MRYLLYALLIWFLYNLIFRFIIPVYRTSRQVRRKFREMQENQQGQAHQQQGFTPPPSKKSNTPRPAGDYIDFEEIK